jgi:hypothetical protein
MVIVDPHIGVRGRERTDERGAEDERGIGRAAPLTCDDGILEPVAVEIAAVSSGRDPVALGAVHVRGRVGVRARAGRRIGEHVRVPVVDRGVIRTPRRGRDVLDLVAHGIDQDDVVAELRLVARPDQLARASERLAASVAIEPV